MLATVLFTDIVASTGKPQRRLGVPRVVVSTSVVAGKLLLRGSPSFRWHTLGTREGKNLSHPPESNRRPADYESISGRNPRTPAYRSSGRGRIDSAFFLAMPDVADAGIRRVWHTDGTRAEFDRSER